MTKRLQILAMSALAVCSVAEGVEASSLPAMRGLVATATGTTPTGVCSLPTSPGGEWNLIMPLSADYGAFYSGVEKDDIFYAIRCNAQYGSPITYVDAYSLETGENLWTNYPAVTQLSYDLTVNTYDDRIYGFFSNAKNTGVVFGTIEYKQSGNTMTPIKEMEGAWSALAAAPNGDMYAISTESERTGTGLPVILSSTLYKIDRLTGETTKIGVTGELPLAVGSAAIDPKSGRMFWTVTPSAESSYLCEVDLSTGIATKVLDFDEGRTVLGLTIPAPLAEDGAPAAVTDLATEFDGGSLSGNITFTAPATLFDGTPATGQLSYTILANGEAAASGTSSFGSIVTAPVTVAERGEYKFTVSVANAVGSSPKATVDSFLGFGKPSTPSNTKAVIADGKTLVSWDAVTSATDRGYLNPADIRYKVTRMPDGLIVADGVSATSCTADIPTSEELQSFTYVVKAINNGLYSDDAISNNVVYGYVNTLPWSEGFDNAEAMQFFTVVDANNDGKTWEQYSDRVRVKFGSVTMDDWLITPGIHMSAGNTYRVTFRSRSSMANYPEKIEAKWGADNTPAAMTGTLVTATTVGGEYESLEGFVTPVADGIYYIGLHGISDADMYYLDVDDIVVETGMSMDAPSQASDFSAIANADGEYRVNVSLTAPSTNIKGETVDALTKLELSRDGNLINTFDNPAPGTTLRFTDELEYGGNVKYTAIAWIGSNAGQAVETMVFVGTPAAQAPESVTITENEPGNVTLTWDKVTKSEEGADINPEKVKYNIYSTDNTVVAENVEETSYTFNAVEEGTQEFVKYSVCAVTDAGESQKTESAEIPVGTAYSDFVESYSNGIASTIYTTERINYGNWSVRNDEFAEVKAQDGDGGYMEMAAYFAGYCGAMLTGKVQLPSEGLSGLKFYSYTPDDQKADLNNIVVYARETNGEWQEVLNSTVVELGESQGWHEVTVPLYGFSGKDVSFKFIATTYDRPYTSTYIDNLSVVEIKGTDMIVEELKAPKYARTGENFNVTLSFANNGAETAEGAEAVIYADGVAIDTIELPALAAREHETVSLPIMMHALSTNPVDFHVEISHPSDTETDNNISDIITVIPVTSELPIAKNLTAKRNEDNIQLNWEAPLLNGNSSETTDDFDNAEAWAHEAEAWMLVDCDNAPVMGFQEVELPGISVGKTKASFFVFSATDIFEGNKYLLPHSGTQYLAALARYDNGMTDDWAISPELSGEEQTVSFHARSYHQSYPERIEVWYSTGSILPEDFVSTQFAIAEVPGDWTRYEVKLPEGARYFAIRSCASNSFMLMIDDVTYTPIYGGKLQPVGYNVYRDGVKVNGEPVETLGYTDIVSDEEEHSWVVTTLYSQGESKASNSAKAVMSGIDGKIADNVTAYGGYGFICIEGADTLPVSVVTADGKVIYNGIATNSIKVNAVPGVYVVKIGTSSIRVLVK